MISEVCMNLGYKILLDSDVYDYHVAATTKEYDTHILRMMFRLIGREAVVFDIGANIGHYTLALGTHLRDENILIHAFEPVSNNYELLRRSIALNNLGGLVEAHRLAFGERRGQLVLHIPPEGQANNAIGDDMLAGCDREHVEKNGWKTDTAEMTRLDDWTGENNITRCDFIKIDVEGAEIGIFANGTEFLKKTRPVILGEFNPYWLKSSGHDFGEAISLFEGLGYTIHREIDGVFVDLTPDLIATGQEIPNYLFVPAEKQEILRNLN